MTVYLSRLLIPTLRTAANCRFLTTCLSDIQPVKNQFFLKKNDLFRIGQQLFRSHSSDTIQPTSMALDNTSLPLKKKSSYKKPALEEVTMKEGHYLTLAYATANCYDLKALREGLVQQKLYVPGT